MALVFVPFEMILNGFNASFVLAFTKLDSQYFETFN